MKLRVILLSLAFLFSSTVAFAQSFSDVSSSNPNYKAIEDLKFYGIIKGYSDGTFRPKNNVNRAEALKITLLGSGIEAPIVAGNGGFPDVDEKEWYAPYVVKAKNLGIIKGNADGTFMPTRNVNLAEMLKILLVSNGIRISQQVPDTAPYSDVSLSEWYAPYFVYAKDNALLDQKSYEKVVPGHALTRAEIAELIYRLRVVVKDQQTNIAFASYYSDSLQGQTTASGELYDKTKFTASHKTLAFGTRVEVTNTLNNKSVIVTINDRGPAVAGRELDLSQAAFEAISPLSKGVIPIAMRVIDATTTNMPSFDLPKSAQCVLGEKADEIPVDYFVNTKNGIDIQLYFPLRGSFYENEVVDVSGKVSDQKIKIVTAFVKDDQGKQTVFSSPVKNGDFMIQIDMGKKGDKQISFIPGDSGSNFVASITVDSPDCDKIFTSTAPSATQNYRFAIEQNQLIFRWDIGTAALSRVIIQQADHQMVRYFSFGKKGWKVFPSLFEGFSQGEFSVRIDTASSSGNPFDRSSDWMQGEVKKFVAIQHHFSEVNDEFVQMNAYSDTYGFGGEIAVSGRSKAPIRPELAIITPSGNVDLVPFITKAQVQKNGNGIEEIPTNTTFDAVYKPQEKGTYILEINHSSGVAAFNVPIYEAGSIPLLPDFMDIKRSSSFNETPKDIQTTAFSVELLNLINQERKSAMKDQVELDDSLALLAQARADDMAKNNYLSHWDKNGKSANDLRVQFGITTSVGENLAKETSVAFAHAGLMRSALHRKNILDAHWTRAGFGFAKAQDGGLLVVEVLSSSPITVDQLPALRDEVLSLINSKRESFLLPSAALSSIAQIWSDQMASQNFFDFQSPQNETLSDAIRKGGVVQTVGTFIIGNSSWLDVRDVIAQHNEVFDARWKKLGVGITQDKDGIIKMTLLYSE